MRRKLTVKAQADLDVVSHYVYLLGRNPAAAQRFRLAIKTSYQRIKRDPQSCAALTLEGFEDRELRFCRPPGFNNYLILIQVTDQGPTVVRVLHGSQDIALALRGR